MLDEAEYASDTDESDEDYMPEADGGNVASENESDGEPENALDDDDGGDIKSNRRSRKRTATATATASDSKRSKAADTATSSKSTEKDELVDDDDDANEDALWAKFLGNAEQTDTTPKSSQPNKPSISSSSSSSSNGSSTAKQPPKDTTKAPTATAEKKVTVTEIFEFAGEKVEVQKEIKVSEANPTSLNNDAKQIDRKIAAAKPISGVALPSLSRRSGGGLSSVLGQIGKKNKLSVLEKTQLDWNGFKRNEGIDEELQTHNKGRGGFLERQDFLQRTDLRQFEIEKSMRQTTRRK